jgi:hypothetical protein
MKSTLKKSLLVGMASLFCALSLSSCGGVHIKPGDNGLYDQKNNVAYYHVSPVYEAKSLLKEYGKLTITEDLSYKVFTIPGAEATEMLATEEYNIVCSTDLDMPTLMEMMPTALLICSDFNALKRLEDPVQVATLASTYTSGESIAYPGTSPVRSYKIRFESTAYAGFYYTLTYVEYAEDLVIEDQNYGKYFLYDVSAPRFVPVGKEIHDALGLE